MKFILALSILLFSVSGFADNKKDFITIYDYDGYGTAIFNDVAKACKLADGQPIKDFNKYILIHYTQRSFKEAIRMSKENFRNYCVSPSVRVAVTEKPNI